MIKHHHSQKNLLHPKDPKTVIIGAQAPKTVINGAADENQIKSWKKLYGEVYEIIVDGHACYVRSFDRTTMKYALSHIKIKVSHEGSSEVSMALL